MVALRFTARNFDRAGAGLLAVNREIKTGGSDRLLHTVGQLVIREVQRGIRDQRSPDGTAYPIVTRFGSPGQRLRDTSRLLNSITYEIRGSKLFVGTNLAYAATQHFGEQGRKAKTARLIAIPMSRTVARAYRAGVSLREQYPDAFVFKSLSQGLFLVRKAGVGRSAKRQLEFLFRLVPSVDIQGVGFLGVSSVGGILIGNVVSERFGVLFNAGGRP